LGTRVRLVGILLRGGIVLPYSSVAELERIHARLTGGPTTTELEQIQARRTDPPASG
jgi:hypothetical protein